MSCSWTSTCPAWVDWKLPAASLEWTWTSRSSRGPRAGAAGYLTKGVSSEELVTATRRVFLGKRYLSSDVAQELAISAFDDTNHSPFEQLSNRIDADHADGSELSQGH
jgi:hypothetical protein